jgi:hypothetical protein
MAGSKEDSFYLKAKKLKLFPLTTNLYDIRNDPGAYSDLHEVAPLIGTINSNNCLVLDRKNRKYVHEYGDSDIVLRISKNLLLKYSLSNL